MRYPLPVLLALVLLPMTSLAGDQVGVGKEMAQVLAEWEEKPVVDVPIDSFDPRRGPDDAPVTVAVFSDFQCRPFCARAAGMLEELAGRYSEVRFVFKHYPLNGSCNPSTTTQMHGQACAAAFGAQCAGQQGFFWSYHDVLFETDLADGVYEPIARQLGLDVPRWRECVASEQVREQVGIHAAQGKSVGVRGTPSWVINGRKGSGLAPERLEALVRYELGKAGRHLPQPVHTESPR